MYRSPACNVRAIHTSCASGAVGFAQLPLRSASLAKRAGEPLVGVHSRADAAALAAEGAELLGVVIVRMGEEQFLGARPPCACGGHSQNSRGLPGAGAYFVERTVSPCFLGAGGACWFGIPFLSGRPSSPVANREAAHGVFLSESFGGNALAAVTPPVLLRGIWNIPFTKCLM